MGQYYEVINITKKEQIENNNCGWKLMEFSYVGNRKTDQLWVALSDEWKNDTVLVCGDYYSSDDDANCNPCAAEMERLAGVEPGCLCDYADENYKECDFDTSKVPNYAINPNTKQYVNRNHAQLEGCYTEGSEKKAVTYGYFIDPLSLLLTAGNGQGGGDYRGNNIDLVGSWVKDSQAVYTVYQKSEIPADYTELIPDFIEDRYSNVPNLRKDDPALSKRAGILGDSIPEMKARFSFLYFQLYVSKDSYIVQAILHTLCHTICMNNKYIHGRTCVYNINYHIVWCIKYRRKVLTPQISETLYSILQEVAQDKGFTLVECKVGEMDHVHCFVSAPPKLSITQIVKYLKGISGRKLFEKFPTLRQSLWHGQLWNGSYFVETIGSTSEENIRRYIERQKNCQM